MNQRGGSNGAALNIDDIVREVMARLNGDATSKPTPQAGHTNTDELRLTGRVITTAELDGQLDGVRRVLLAAKSVLTPSARDLLREKQIEIAVVNKSEIGTKHRLVIGVAESNYDVAALARSIEQEGTPVEQLAQTGVVSVVDEMCDAVGKGGQLGLLLTSQAAVGACLANRQRGVRAAACSEPAAVASAVDSLGLNFLVLRPVGHSFFQLRQAVREFLVPKTRVCPAAYANRLN